MAIEEWQTCRHKIKRPIRIQVTWTGCLVVNDAWVVSISLRNDRVTDGEKSEELTDQWSCWLQIETMHHAIHMKNTDTVFTVCKTQHELNFYHLEAKCITPRPIHK